MEKIIKYGFRPVRNNRVRGQNDAKGKKLFKSGHVLNVQEIQHANSQVDITATVVPQTSVSNVYNVKITLDDDRNISNAECSCKAGLSGRCKHMCAVIHYINSAETALSKTSRAQEWGKPSHRQLLGYDKGARMTDLFTPPALSDQLAKLQPLKIESENFPESLAGTPLCTMLNIERKNEIEITAAVSLVELVRINERRTSENKARSVVMDIFMLQSLNKIYTQTNSIASDLNDFYVNQVCCDVDAALDISVQTIHQSKSDEWFKQRILRVTASNGHKLKGNRFNIDKVITDLLTPGKVTTSAMAYGRKMEDIALQAYKKQLVDSSYEIIKVGLIINLQQPWLSCSPDAILVYGQNIWQKRLIEIKCPYKCKKVPIFDSEVRKCNVQYLKVDENGLQLSKTHSIYTQVQLQMYVTNIALCDLFVYSPLGSVLITIARDDLVLITLVPQLEKFYFGHYIQRLLAKYA